MSLQDSQPSNDNDAQRLNAIVLIAVLMVVGFLFWLVVHLRHGVLYENCHMAGFRNCISDCPVITAPHRRDRLE
jgi:hypothetical protein